MIEVLPCQNFTLLDIALVLDIAVYTYNSSDNINMYSGVTGVFYR